MLATLATRLQQAFAHVLIVTTPDHQFDLPAGRIVSDYNVKYTLSSLEEASMIRTVSHGKTHGQHPGNRQNVSHMALNGRHT